MVQQNRGVVLQSGKEELLSNWATHLLAACIPRPPLFGGTSESKIGRGSVGCEILCLRVELVLERGSLELMDDRPWPLEVERLNHFEGFEKICVMPPEGDEDREVLRKLAGEEGEGVVVAGGLRVLDVVRRGAMRGEKNVKDGRAGEGGKER